MVGSRTATAAIGLVASLAVSVAVWYYFDSLILFLVVPFVPFLFRSGGSGEHPVVRRCPACGFESRIPEYTHCPRDGTRLERRSEE